MFKASEIHGLLSLTESFFNEEKGFTLLELLKMDLTAMIKAVRSIDALKDKPRLSKLVFEGIAMIRQMESHGGKVRTQELRALEKVFPFKDVQAAMSSAIQAYNKKIGYDPISMTQKESVEERMMSGSAGNVNFKPRGAGQSTKKPMKSEHGNFYAKRAKALAKYHHDMAAKKRLKFFFGDESKLIEGVGDDLLSKINRLNLPLVKDKDSPDDYRHQMNDAIEKLKRTLNTIKHAPDHFSFSKEYKEFKSILDDLKNWMDGSADEVQDEVKQVIDVVRGVYDLAFSDYDDFKKLEHRSPLRMQTKDFIKGSIFAEGGPGSGGQYLTRKFKMPMSPYISVGTRKGILKNMPFDLEDVPLAKITHVAQAKFVPQKVKNLCKNPDVITKYPVCLLKIPSQDCYHVMDGHHRFLAAQKLGIEKLPAKVWIKFEEEPVPAEPELSSEPQMGEGEPLPVDQAPVEQAVELPSQDEVPSQEAMPLPEPEASPEPNPEMLPPDDSANAATIVPDTAADVAIVGVPGEHDHYEVMCEKCQKVTESCGCMAEEKAKRTTVCESCKAMSFIESKKLPMSLKEALKVLGSKGSF